mgnify:FL=1
MKTRPLWSNFSLLLLCLITGCLSSCSFVTNSEGVIKSKNLIINFKRAGWKSIAPDKGDFAFRNEKSKSYILVNSLCRKYDNTTLEQLTDNLLAGLQRPIIAKQSEKRLFDRSALKTEATGALDGVKTSMLILVVKKDRCIYDFALISQTENLGSTLEADFEQLLNSTQVVSP